MSENMFKIDLLELTHLDLTSSHKQIHTFSNLYYCSGTGTDWLVRQTLRSWLHKTSTIIRTFSSGLEKYDTLKFSSNKIPGITHMSAFLENCRITISMFCCSPRENVLKSIRPRGQICPVISTQTKTLSPGLKYKNTVKYISYNFPGNMN